MSYNIDTFKVKQLKDLVMPVESLYAYGREDWHFDRINNDDGSVTFKGMATELHGVLSDYDNNLTINKIMCRGEGSGTEMNEMLEPAFKDSKGILIASCVWEGGDCINRLEVNNGHIEWVDIEI